MYLLATQDGKKRALKVFKTRYRLPALVALADKLAPFTSLPGLQVCRRIILTPQRYKELLRQHPDLIYAVLMPWIAGLTWNAPLGPPTASNPGSTHSPSVAPGLTPCNSRAVHRLPKRKPTSAIKTRPQI